MKAYKFLRPGAIGLFSRFVWPKPVGNEPGAWCSVEGELVACENGFHACRPADLPHWVAAELWEVELEGDLVDVRDGILGRRCRLVRPVEGWLEGGDAEFARACAHRALALAAGDASPDQARTAAFAHDAQKCVNDGTFAVAAYCAAMAAASLAAESEGEAAFRAERAWQSRWLAERFGLV